MPIKDPEKRKAKQRLWYARHRAAELIRLAAVRLKLRHSRVEWMQNYKREHGCVRCGESHPACLHFHHRDPELKLLEVSRAVQSFWSMKRLLAEIEKCDLLCANCHLKSHGEERARLPQIPRPARKQAIRPSSFGKKR